MKEMSKCALSISIVTFSLTKPGPVTVRLWMVLAIALLGRISTGLAGMPELRAAVSFMGI